MIEYGPMMMRLSAGDFSQLAEVGRLLCSGVEIVGQASSNYQAGALVPSTDRRPLSDKELTELWVPPDQADIATAYYLPASEELDGHVTVLLENQKFDFSITNSAPNQVTTTSEDSDGTRVGLHLDNHQGLALGCRGNDSLPRLGTNRGPGARYVLLGSLSVFGIVEQAGIIRGDGIPTTEDVRNYVANAKRDWPELTAYWLRLDPGDAYVVPTELCVHDGSTYGESEGSTIFFVIGASLKALLPVWR